MKKLLSVGLLTVCALAISEHKAQAWMNAKFSIGLNWHIQSGNNNWLWGFWKNGQVPGPEAFGGGMPYGPVPLGSNPPGGTFPYFGSAPGYPPTETSPPPQAARQQAYYNAPQSYYYNPYQTVGYQTGAYQPNYYYPVYDPYYAYSTPYYWYQGR